jgi:hypothetical protein
MTQASVNQHACTCLGQALHMQCSFLPTIEAHGAAVRVRHRGHAEHAVALQDGNQRPSGARLLDC